LLVKHVILILHEANAQWQDVYALLHFVAHALNMVQSGGILLCRDNQLRGRHRCKGIVNELNVLSLKLMVVSEGQWL
jgi:hypothetical protein